MKSSAKTICWGLVQSQVKGKEQIWLPPVGTLFISSNALTNKPSTAQRQNPSPYDVGTAH
jgi:hypothetical protein